jgi:hypothetical protein
MTKKDSVRFELKKSMSNTDFDSMCQKPVKKSLARQMILNPATNLFSSLIGASRMASSLNGSREASVNRTKEAIDPKESSQVQMPKELNNVLIRENPSPPVNARRSGDNPFSLKSIFQLKSKISSIGDKEKHRRTVSHTFPDKPLSVNQEISSIPNEKSKENNKVKADRITAYFESQQRQTKEGTEEQNAKKFSILDKKYKLKSMIQ